MDSRSVAVALRWIAPVFVLKLALSAFYLWPGGPAGQAPAPAGLAIDEGTVLYDSLRIARGEVMYRDFFEFQGPVFYHLNAALFSLTGPSMTAARGLFLVLSALSTALTAHLVARLAGRWAGVGAGLLHAFLFVPIFPYAYPHWYAETFVLLGLTLQVGARERPLRLAGAGLCYSLASLTIQSLGLPALAAATAGAALPGLARRDRARVRQAVGPIAVGATAAVAVVSVYFAVAGGFGAWIYDTLIWPFAKYESAQTDAVEYAAYWSDMLRVHGEQPLLVRSLTAVGLTTIALLPLLTIPAVIVSARDALRALDDAEAIDQLILSVTGLAAIAPLFLKVSRPDLTHIAFVAGVTLPAAAIAGRARPRFVVQASVALGTMALGLYLHKAVITWERSRKLASWPAYVTQDFRPILAKVPPGDSMVVPHGAGFLHLYGPPSGLSFTFVPDPPSYYTEAQWRTMVADIERNRPAIMLLTRELQVHFSNLGLDLSATYKNTGRYRAYWVFERVTEVPDTASQQPAER